MSKQLDLFETKHPRNLKPGEEQWDPLKCFTFKGFLYDYRDENGIFYSALGETVEEARKTALKYGKRIGV